MLKIVTHPLYSKCIKVLESCKTKDQLENAFQYISLAEKSIKREYSVDDGSASNLLCNWSNFHEIEKWFDKFKEKYKDKLFTNE